MIRHRSPASSSFVLAATRLRALQLDPGPRDGRKYSSYEEEQENDQTKPGRYKQVTGPGQHALLTTGPPWVRLWRRRARAGCGGLAVRGEQVEERADPEAFLGGVPEQVVTVHGVPGAPAGPGAGEIARCFQVGHDDLDGPLGEADGGADVADPRGGGAGDLYQHVPVPGQQRPAAPALVSNTHTR